MPSRNSTGKWVSRAGATGGNRVYRSRAPVNWYIGIIVVIVLGVVSVGFARYQRQNPSSTTTSHTPSVVGVAFYRCGTQEVALPSSPSSHGGVTTSSNGVVTVSASKAANATLGSFVASYPKLVLTQNSFGYPGKATLKNGDRCPAGTPDAGKPGAVKVVHWANFSQTHGSAVSGDPLALPLKSGELISMAFVPAGTSVPQPPASTRSALLQAIANPQASTSTTTPSTAPATSLPPASSTTTPATGSSTTTPAASTGHPATTPTTAKK